MPDRPARAAAQITFGTRGTAPHRHENYLEDGPGAATRPAGDASSCSLGVRARRTDDCYVSCWLSEVDGERNEMNKSVLILCLSRSSSGSNNGAGGRRIAFKEKPKRKTNVIRVAPFPRHADSISSSFPDSLDKILDLQKVGNSWHETGNQSSLDDSSHTPRPPNASP